MTDSTLPAPDPAPSTRAVDPCAGVLRAAAARLRRWYPDRSADDRDDALQEAALAAIRCGRLVGPFAVRNLAGDAARNLSGLRRRKGGGTRPAGSPACRSIAGPVMRIAGGDGGPDEWLAEVPEAPPDFSPDARLARALSPEQAADLVSALRASVGGRGLDADSFRALLGLARLRGWSMPEIGRRCQVTRQAVDGWCLGGRPAGPRRASATAALRALLAGDPLLPYVDPLDASAGGA